jgi:hypothetical protein
MLAANMLFYFRFSSNDCHKDMNEKINQKRSWTTSAGIFHEYVLLIGTVSTLMPPQSYLYTQPNQDDIS